MSSTFDEAVDKKAERRRLLHSDKYNRVGFKQEKVTLMAVSTFSLVAVSTFFLSFSPWLKRQKSPFPS